MTTYKYPLPHYAKEYDLSLSTIKRYAKKGYSLDDPKTLESEVALQKNVPVSVYKGMRGPKQPLRRADRRGIAENIFNILVVGQRMVIHSNRVMRCLRGLVLKGQPIPVEVFNLLARGLTNEQQRGIYAMAKAAAGAAPRQIIAEELADIESKLAEIEGK